MPLFPHANTFKIDRWIANYASLHQLAMRQCIFNAFPCENKGILFFQP